MTVEVPQWVRQSCRMWGRQKRRIWAGGDWYGTSTGEKRRHVDGYAQSFLGRVQDEKYAAGASEVRQHWPEVYWGDALDVQRVIFGMAEYPFLALHLHYVFDPEFGLVARRKAYLLGICVREYWRSIERSEHWVWARLAPCDLYPTLKLLNGKGDSLTGALKRRRKPAKSDSMGVVSLAALQRPTLSVKR